MKAQETATLVTAKGDTYEVPLVCSFSHTIGGQTFLFVVTRSEGAVPGTVFPDPHLYIVSHAASGCKVASFRMSLREGVLGAAQTAVDKLVAKVGAARARSVLDGARNLPKTQE